MSRGRLIPGFDYRAQKPVQHTRAEWRDMIAAEVRKLGRRKVDGAPGETWALDKEGRVVLEAYAVIPA